MEMWGLDKVKTKLKLFKDDITIERMITDCLAKAGLEKKDQYSKQEMEIFLQTLSTYGGYYNFVAQNLKFNLLYSQLKKQQGGTQL